MAFGSRCAHFISAAAICLASGCIVQSEYPIDPSFAPGLNLGKNSNTNLNSPVIGTLSNQSATASVSIGPFSVALTDADGNLGSIILTATSSNTTILPNANITIGGSGATRTLTLAPAANQTGTTTITVTASDGTNSSSKTFTATWNGINLEVPIEFASTKQNTVSQWIPSKTRYSVYLDPTAYDGNPTYYLEVIYLHQGAANWEIYLKDSAATNYSTITLTPNTGYTRSRTVFTPATTAKTYHLENNAVSENVYMSNARIIIQQTNATKTKLYVPLSIGENLWSDGNDVGATGATTTSTTYASIGGWGKLWKKEASKLTTLSGSTPWTFEAVVDSNNALGVASVALYNHSTTTAVTGAEVSTSATTPTLVQASFSDSATGFTDGSNFIAYYKTNNAAYTTRLYRAGLWVTLNPLLKGQVFYFTSCSNAPNWWSNTGTFEGFRTLIDQSLFSNPTAYYETSAYVGAATGTDTLQDHGTNDTGTAGTSAVAGASFTLTTTQTRQRSGALSLTNGNRYFTTFTCGGCGPTTTQTSCILIEFGGS